MFIREIKKKNPGYDKEFITHRLVESYRTEKGPRQRTILNLGTLDLPKEQWKLLADRIEAEISGQQSFYPVDEDVEKRAVHYAQLIIQKRLIKPEAEDRKKEEPQYETVNLNSLTNSKSRNLGAEHIGFAAFKMLGLDTLFSRLGFNDNQGALAALSIIGKLVHPGSEQQTRRWAQNVSALGELLNTDFTHLGNNALYRISDMLLTHKDRIEKHLADRERDLFSLKENIILYDLTNTYLVSDRKLGKT